MEAQPQIGQDYGSTPTTFQPSGPEQGISRPAVEESQTPANGDIISAMIKDSHPKNFSEGLTFPSGSIESLAAEGIRISIPEIKEVKEGLIYTYLMYTIIITVTDREGNEKEFIIHRRYSDFDWLFHNFEVKYGGCIIPLPPPKNVLTTVGQQDRDFVETRKRELIQFITKCIRHPFLRNTPELKIFLSDDNGFNDLKKKEKNLEKNKGLKFLSNISKIISGASKDTIFDAEDLDDVDSSLFACRTALKNYKRLLEKFSNLINNYVNLQKKQEEIERPFVRGLENILTQVSKSTEFGDVFRQMAKSQKVETEKDLTKDIHMRLEKDLKNIFNTIESGNLAITRRNLLAKEYDTLQQTLDEKREIGELDEKFYETEEQFHKVEEKLAEVTDTLLEEIKGFEEDLQTSINEFIEAIWRRKKHYFRDMKEDAQLMAVNK